nr:MAG TPA_asm: hypothetical protein [Caudoviricetes sp.]
MSKKRESSMTKLKNQELLNLPITECNRQNQKRKSVKSGRRKKKKSKRREFYETRLGYFIQHEAPLEYDIIMDVSGGCEPNVDMIEALGYASLNPLFRKSKFRRALIEYRKRGCHTHHPKQATVITEISYIKKRRMLKNI